ncbi:protein POLLENLESS 3-LIKE 2 isoform X1 [Cryptomeria japonica]|uniref:protein POLLENLESS 3-LIKE 2 isoform X1 n=1 Tax=Cryptomeria japonica TaxID=3369 RepID=UPI0025AD2999|nr:protein POLLENLESS 3-LIKE 2 isoform X1 [Cryptomeria japonica]
MFNESASCSSDNPVGNKALPNLPAGNTPYAKAKHAQMVDKDPEKAIALFRAAIDVGDKVDSSLKDMAIVMKQQNMSEEAIEAIKSLRNRCSDEAQESLDNVLLELYKGCGRMDEHIMLLNHKLNLINQGLLFHGKRAKTAKSQGKKITISIEQETLRLLGNLGWAYLQQSNYMAAEAVYRKALSIESDNNKICNLGICLMHQGKVAEAKMMLQNVKPASANDPQGLDSHLKSYERAQHMLKELEENPI